ncbi:MAG TPA: GntR family transcriptional regulator [Verrucomicrobiae bacterium]|jgi:GntR family transcriptional regulator
MFEINHQAPVPLRAQVESLLRNIAQRPEYQNGALLPDELTLATQLGVSRGTVRSGISKLVYEGLLERKPGVGTKVSDRAAESGILAWRSFSREMASKGIKVENYYLDYDSQAVGEDVAKGLQVDEGVKVWRVERIRGWEGRPVLYNISWFHPRLKLKGTEDFNGQLYEVLEAATGVQPRRAREEFMAVIADERKAKMLHVNRGEPLLLRRHVVFDAGKRAVEFSEVYYVSSRFTLTLDLMRAAS